VIHADVVAATLPSLLSLMMGPSDKGACGHGGGSGSGSGGLSQVMRQALVDATTMVKGWKAEWEGE